MEVIKKFILLTKNRDKVSEYAMERLKPHLQEYDIFPSPYYPYYTIGFIPVRVARFFVNEVSLYVSPGIYPIYSYIPFLRTVSILVPSAYAKFTDKYQISIPENAFYEVEIVLDKLSYQNASARFDKYSINVALITPISQSSFALPTYRVGLLPYVKFWDIYIREPLYFHYECYECSNNSRNCNCEACSVYVLKPFLISPVVQTILEIWSHIENIGSKNEEDEEDEDEEEV
jgi:hypothetical protein